MENKRSNRRLLAAGLIGLIVFIVTNFYPYFPGVDTDAPEIIPPEISKEEAAAIAVAYMEDAGFSGPFDHYVMYQNDTDLDGYLQKNHLAAEYYERFGSDYPLDYYQVELKQDGRIWLVDVHLQEGRVIGWQETTAEPQTADAEAAEQLALEFASGLGFSPDRLEPVSHDSGHHIFRVAGQTIGEAELQLHVLVSGEQVAGFYPRFAVPGDYLAWYRDQQLRMESAGFLSLGVYLLIALAAAIFAAVYRRSASFRRGLVLTAVYIVLSTISNLNSYPSIRVLYPGQPDSDLAASFSLAFAEIFTIIFAAAMYLGLVSGDAAFRSKGMNLWASWRDHDYSSHVVTSLWRGFLISLIILGVQGIIYWTGTEYLDVWTVNDPSFSIYNYVYPALFPLAAWVAGISEEAIYRVFGIALFRKLFRSTGIAILLSSMIWAVAHIGYPVFPAYTRFFEVTILGFLFSWAYLRYGFITAVFAHVIFDSILMGLSLMGMGGTADLLLGVFYIVLPVIIAYAIRWLHSRTDFRPQVARPRD